MKFEHKELIIAITIVVFAIIYATVQYYKFYKTEHFVCPKCGYCWKPQVL